MCLVMQKIKESE